MTAVAFAALLGAAPAVAPARAGIDARSAFAAVLAAAARADDPGACLTRTGTAGDSAEAPDRADREPGGGQTAGPEATAVCAAAPGTATDASMLNALPAAATATSEMTAPEATATRESTAGSPTKEPAASAVAVAVAGAVRLASASPEPALPAGSASTAVTVRPSTTAVGGTCSPALPVAAGEQPAVLEQSAPATPALPGSMTSGPAGQGALTRPSTSVLAGPAARAGVGAPAGTARPGPAETAIADAGTAPPGPADTAIDAVRSDATIAHAVLTDAAVAQASPAATLLGAPAQAPAIGQAASADVPRAVASQVLPAVVNLVQRPAGEHRLTLTVHPDSLGPVTVRAHIGREGDVRVELIGATDAGREALRTIVADLRRDLATVLPQASLSLSAGSDGAGRENPLGAGGDPAPRGAPQPDLAQAGSADAVAAPPEPVHPVSTSNGASLDVVV